MSNEPVYESNHVYLEGTVVGEPVFSHELYGEGFYELMLSVPRLSEQKDVLPVTISDRLMREHDLKEGNKIAIVGQFRSYNKMVGEHSKLMLTVFVRDFATEGSDNPNTVNLVGYICKPPIYRTTPFNREICDMLVAVNRAYNKSDYIPCIAWGRNARFVRSIEVGQKLIISGRIQSRVYTKKLSENESEERTAYELSVGRISLAGDKE